LQRPSTRPRASRGPSRRCRFPDCGQDGPEHEAPLRQRFQRQLQRQESALILSGLVILALVMILRGVRGRRREDRTKV
jgi:hypothetical protein